MRKRKAGLDDDGDVTYINDANKVFNKKINRYFDKYTAEYVFRIVDFQSRNSYSPVVPCRIRANFERGTAL
jgi:hypothetical protein